MGDRHDRDDRATSSHRSQRTTAVVVAFDAALSDDARTMHDNASRQRPESVQTPGQTAGQTTVPIAEAAARLGISADAVRKRIQRGKLTGHKTDQGWTVVWTELDIRPDSVQTGVQDQSAVVARLESEVEFLRSELSDRTEEIRRRDHIIAGLVESMRALPAGTVDNAPQEAQTGTLRGDLDAMAPTTLRAWLRRLLGR
jgi:hypothetical protein